jgi:TPR repeat protein
MAGGPAARADFADGVSAYEAGDFGGAYDAWLPLAENGDPEAQLAIGILYENGRGVAQDYQQALAWYTRAAEAGHPGAQFNLGNMYHLGTGVPQDSARAVIWWTLAAERGLPGAMLNLGIAYHLGEGVAHDPVRAFELFHGAADAGIPEAQFSTGYAYETGLGTEVDLDEARRFYALAAKAGMRQAADRLAALNTIEMEPIVEAEDTEPAATTTAAQDETEEMAAVPDEPAEEAEVEVAEASEPAPVTIPDLDGWAYIQLAAFLTESRAEVAWRELSGRYPDLLGDLPYRIRKMTASNEAGAIYGVQVGPMPVPEEARAICNALRSRNADCFLTGP